MTNLVQIAMKLLEFNEKLKILNQTINNFEKIEFETKKLLNELHIEYIIRR